MLYTKRTVIRRFDPGDWEDLYAYLSDAVVVHFEPYDVFSMEECIAEAARRAENPAFWGGMSEGKRQADWKFVFAGEGFCLLGAGLRVQRC